MARLPIRAAVLHTAGAPLDHRTLLLDEPLHGEVLVRSGAIGLCHSDLHYADGTLPMDVPAVLGHEVAGVVERVGPGVNRVKVGDRVVATVTPSCGACPKCVSGNATLCERTSQRRHRDRPKLETEDGTPVSMLGGMGTFAEAFVLDEASLAVLPDTVGLDVACLLGCCISTGVGAVTHGAQVSPDDTVAVIGCGGVGMAAIQAARMCGALRVIAIDLHPEKLMLATEMGATDVVVSGPMSEVIDAVREIVPNGVTRSFEAVGRPETAELAFDLLAPRGIATILGLMPAGKRISVDAGALIEGDRRIQGAYMGANQFLADVPMLVDQYERGVLDLRAMVTSVIPFSDINAGLQAMRSPETIRTVVSFE
ncbi:alcohol dehydrogenase catalytic domain-containing protein [Microbacterium sp. YJN-G]|jgi:alcohol dehydrogenase/S-(hydroxymethyl)glutathione dehydrogenase/alcohol dehydrogenase|uniref:alcohol dehydrogenase catalytic domain-containing protein n=1 Tax=unclassified Microbacterium TaxID=2609290 RepID=UPI00187821FF|nr:alcohol dehydrogenase catalytic domain-containing protein [Microbacterium sp. YJN-G]